MDPDPLPVFTALDVTPDVIWIQSVLVLFLLLSSALISGAEVAFFSLQLKSLEDSESEEPNPAIQRVISLLRKPKRLLATILVANNFINIAIVLLFSLLSKTLFDEIDKVTGPKTKKIVEKYCRNKLEKKSLRWLLRKYD